MKYDITHSCGHTERVELFGMAKTREWRVSVMEQEVCPECAQKLRDAENAKAAQEAHEAGLPELTGTPKQILWAEKLRMDFVRKADKLSDDFPTFTIKDSEGNSVEHQAIEYVDAVLTRTEASWWIDHKNGMFDRSLAATIMREAEQVKEKENVDAAAIAEMMVRPESITEEELITIVHAGKYVRVSSDRRNDRLVEIVKSLGYAWDSEARAWQMRISVLTGAAEDRMTEVSCYLLAAGFKLLVSDEIVRQKIASSDYEPIYPRWISTSGDELRISWGRKDDDMYNRAKSLPSAHYHDYMMLISPKRYKEIRDFARAYDFRISANAEKELGKWENAEKAALLVQPTVKKPAAPKSDSISDLMKQGDEIIPDLRDD